MEVVFGIAMNSHPDVAKTEKDNYIYITAVEVSADDKIPSGMVELNIPAQTYAKFLYRGHVVDYMATYRKIWNNWIPESKIEVSDGPEIEVYDERFNLESADSEFDLLVPVRA